MAKNSMSHQWQTVKSRWLEQAKYDVARLRKLGVDIEYLSTHYHNSLTPQDINDLLNGVLYLKEKYPHIWKNNNEIKE
jgi:hypothetical protein